MTSTLDKFPRLNAPNLHKLPNGLTIVAEQMPVEAVNLSLWIKVGSSAESDAINGMAHFLEHMIFKGTERLASGEFERRIEERGAVTNAATSQDYTHYYITTAPKDFAELAPLQIDVVTNASIPDDAFERERLVVLEEIRRSEDNPRRRTYRRAMETAFDKLPYRRAVLGPEEVIAGLKPQQMRDFHATWYQPQSITAVAVGNLPVEELIATVSESFTQVLKTPHSPLPTPYFPLPTESAFTEIVRREFIDETLQQARLVMLWRVPGMVELEQTYGLDVLAAILGHGRTSRLVQDLKEERKLVSSISASNISHEFQGTFYISAKCAVENLAEVENAIAQHIRSLHTELVKESEIARVRRRVANRFIFGNETPSDRAGLYGYYQSLVGDLEPAFNYPAKIENQDAIELMQAAKQYLSFDAYGVVILKP
ncbi:MAG: M16 family metallopeptidase [Nostoc sp. ZfuVER08]|jgi:predicted Zn-dependent peptidase|uniref:Insulinase family protein n=1 Tax=Nostoc punctiforme FACHB-252 TaxID=1357509 RepID=A0ABR8H7V0_NOSPU|nr:pitrilysin family protein [Nostoc punctiforme]MBD2611921.1 insulinase family protein [Nostoc punctiforme FACHB-252]MBL1201457.1 insulinase family protein [Nostoc sp. GBBB01]MDZ8015913.1 pitrilysin family protein [Nostoc sp. ZfuVER08]